ncbi:MAG: phosphoribosylformylglycinamidine cyclo-ligase [Spirochaetes bacterium]|nr:phosphoribosylformylglycinamidine cyclo-ligase [Spirochaetota bacterium]
MNKYFNRGVSSKKEDVYNALEGKISSGIFPTAFCKVVEDYLGLDKDYCNIMHSDGAGTKSSLAYIYYKETGDISVFKGIAMDSIVMNVDDLICIGATDNFLLSNTIGRNPHYIPGEVIKTIIQAYEEIACWYSDMGIPMILTGGETADVGDVVRTLVIDSTITVRMKKSDIIANDKIKPDMVILGLSSSGQATYEKEYNSGIGSNGLTSARHDIFNKIYKEKYPESFNPKMPDDLSYCGPFKLTDTHPGLPINIGKAVLSPTRTFAPVIKEILKEYKGNIGGMVHCTGGGQTKCLRFGKNVHYIKNNLFELPPIFKIIQEVSKTTYQEMYQVFNMGHRIEIYIKETIANAIIDICKNFNINAKIIGEIKKNEANDKNKLTIFSPSGEIEFD